ncbi:MAG TPA: glycogen debranching N-terminal domain-containing protein [Longimicrobiales bacterium]|nr:glycogen debranching N-terminal domain-containing protein [Longimicrobiales bacterium]
MRRSSRADAASPRESSDTSLLPIASEHSGLRYAWRGPSILIVESNGRAGHHPLTGFFFRQTRFLRDLRLMLADEPPHTCSIAVVGPAELEIAYVFPEVVAGDGGGSGSGGKGMKKGLLYRDVDLRLRYRVNAASLDVTLLATNRWQQDVELDVSWELSTDYASIDEALFDRPTEQSPVEATAVPGGAVFRHMHAELPFATRIAAGGADWEFVDGGLRARLRLPRQQTQTLTLRVEALDPEDPIDAIGEALRQEALEAWHAGVMELDAPGAAPLAELANRAALDLGSMALLEGPSDEWLVPAAGVPIYQALWARDALTASWQAGLLDRGDMLEHVLTRLTRLQGTRDDPDRDEQPGRIVNQAKRDPQARLGVSRLDRNYADVASPFMFLIGLGYHYVLTGDREHVRRRWDAARRVVDWAFQYGDRDGDGYIEYLTRAPNGPRHQAWKDSDNAVVGEDGSQVDPPIASCEIQGYWFVSLQFMAVLSVAMGERRRALDLWRQAAQLKERFNRDFWMEDEGCIAFGLDADKRPIRALTSNAGQCLPTGIVAREHIPRLVQRLFEPDLFSGWGIRTLSRKNPAYNPLDYHLGSVWPVENGSILFGLRRYGQDERALELARGLYDLARMWRGGRTPECVGGYGREEQAHPGAYPRANSPQTWNQSIWPIVVQSLLGLMPYAPMRLLLVDPILPPWLPELTVRRLRIGSASVSLRFHRDARGRSKYEVLEKHGRLRVIRQPWLESVSADAWERLAGLRDTVLSRGASRA